MTSAAVPTSVQLLHIMPDSTCSPGATQAHFQSCLPAGLPPPRADRDKERDRGRDRQEQREHDREEAAKKLRALALQSHTQRRAGPEAGTSQAAEDKADGAAGEGAAPLQYCRLS